MGDSPSSESDESLEAQERFDDFSIGSNPSDAGGFAGDTPQQQAVSAAVYARQQRDVADKARRGEIEGINLQPSTQDVQTFARQQADIEIMLEELARKKLTKDDAQVKLENEKLDNVKKKIEKAKMEASALHQVQQAFRDSFESSMATAFQSIIEGTSNMKDAFLTMTKSILSAIAQILSNSVHNVVGCK